jgi:hypothetical protein
MAVIDWQEIWNGRRGELDNLRATRRYERIFRAITNSTLDGPATLLEFASLLGLLTVYADANGTVDTGAVLRQTRFEQPESDNPFIWEVRCEFSSEPYDVQQRNAEIEDPLNRPPIFNWEIQKYQRVVDKDVYGNAVSNSAGAPFSPLPEADDTRFVLTMERNEAEPDWNLILTYQDAINSDTFLGFSPGTAKVNLKASAAFENNLYYWKVTYTFEFRNIVTINGEQFSGWDLHLLDQGYYELDANSKPRLILDAQGNPPGEPVPLNGAGKRGLANAVTAVEVTDGGDNYSQANTTISFTGGAGTGAAATAFVDEDEDGHGPITAIFVTNGGSGYTSAPTVAIASPFGTGAAATASIAPAPAYLHYRPYNWLPFDVFDLPESIN